MKYWAKGGLIGFIVSFIALWILLIVLGVDPNGWKCVTLKGPIVCTAFSFFISYVHWAFVLFFSWVGFFGGVVDARIINKIMKKSGYDRKIPLKVTSTILLTLVIVFAIIALLIFDQWVEIMVYTVIFVIFIMIISWIIGKIKYRKH